MTGAQRTRTGRWGDWQPGELGLAAGFFTYLALVVGAFITARVARDALFLSRSDIDTLPYMYVWVALTMALAGVLYSRIADRIRHHRLGLAMTAVWTGLVLLSRALVAGRMTWVYPALYVFVEVMGGLLVIQFWTFAHDVFDTRQAKRLFGWVGAGGVVASVVVGLGIGGLTRHIGAENLLWVCAGLLGACLAIQAALGARWAAAGRPERETKASREVSLLSDWARVFSARHMRLLAWITVLAFAVVTVVDFQFKITARYAFLNREDALASFFGAFHGICGVVSMAVQFFLTGRLLSRWGVVRVLSMLPILLLLGTAGFLIVPALWMATLLRGTDSVLRYTAHDAAFQVLLLPLPARYSGRARAFVDGVLKHMAQGATGLFIALVAPRLDPHIEWLGVASLICLLPWIGATWALRREYLRALGETLDSRSRMSPGFAPLQADARALGRLRETLAAPVESRVLDALEMLPLLRRQDWSQDLDRLLEHDSPRIRQEALRLLAQESAAPSEERIRARMEDPDAGVRAEAVETYGTLLRDRALGRIEPFLEDESCEVRAAAVSILLRFGALDGMLAAAPHLRDLIRSARPDERACGARVLGQSGVRGLYRDLMPLLSDPEPQVRLQAVLAAGRLGSPELMLPLLQSLRDRRVRRAAVQAIAAYGSRAFSTIRTVLGNPREDPTIRWQLPRVLARIGEQGSLDLLTRALEDTDAVLRGIALRSLVSLCQRHPALRPDREVLRRWLHTELKQVYQLEVIILETKPLGAMLLADCLEHAKEQALDRVGLLLRALVPGPAMENALQNLGSPQRNIRANALEVLENLLDEENRRCVIPLLERRLTSLASVGDGLFALMHRDEEGWLRELLGSPDPWTVACALDAIRRKPGAELLGPARGLLGHPDVRVREAAVLCLLQDGTPEDAGELRRRLAADEHPGMRQLLARVPPE